MQKMETVAFPSKTVLVDGYALGGALVQEALIDLVKERIFEFRDVFELTGVPELEKERCGRIGARKSRRKLGIERTPRGGEQKWATAIPDGSTASEAAVRFANLRIDLRADFCHVQFATQNHFVERLHVGISHFPFKRRIFKPMDKSFVNERVVRASRDTER